MDSNLFVLNQRRAVEAEWPDIYRNRPSRYKMSIEHHISFGGNTQNWTNGAMSHYGSLFHFSSTSRGGKKYHEKMYGCSGVCVCLHFHEYEMIYRVFHVIQHTINCMVALVSRRHCQEKCVARCRCRIVFTFMLIANGRYVVATDKIILHGVIFFSGSFLSFFMILWLRLTALHRWTWTWKFWVRRDNIIAYFM